MRVAEQQRATAVRFIASGRKQRWVLSEGSPQPASSRSRSERAAISGARKPDRDRKTTPSWRRSVTRANESASCSVGIRSVVAVVDEVLPLLAQLFANSVARAKLHAGLELKIGACVTRHSAKTKHRNRALVAIRHVARDHAWQLGLRAKNPESTLSTNDDRFGDSRCRTSKVESGRCAVFHTVLCLRHAHVEFDVHAFEFAPDPCPAHREFRFQIRAVQTRRRKRCRPRGA
jgi:hypothetical protein